MGMFRKGQKLDRKKMPRVQFPLVDQEEPDTYIWLRALSAKRAQAMAKSSEAEDGYALVAESAEDDDGKPLFTDAKDAAENLDVGSPTIIAIVKKIGEISGLATGEVPNSPKQS